MPENAKVPVSYEESFQKLRTAYLARLEKSLGTIQNVLAQTQFTKDDLQKVHHLTHGLAGSGAIFGFPEVTDAGRKADIFLIKYLRAMPDGGRLMDEESLKQLGQLMRELYRICDSAAHGSTDQVSSLVFAEKPETEEGPDTARFTVLIADNDPLILHLLDYKFRPAGFRVMLADDGKIARDRIWSARPDLVILDRVMPEMDGLEVLRSMRREELLKAIPVIILSARKEKQDIEAGLRMGAQQYVVKPFIPDDLVALSLKLLEK